MLRLLKRFSAADRGNVALIFGLSVIPFLLLAGFAVDYGRAILVRERLGQAIDAAVLAVGASPQLTNAEAQVFGEEFFETNFADVLDSAAYDVQVSVLDDVVRMSARANVPTTLLALLSQDNISVYQEAEAVRGGQSLELVMVLDNTGSMAGAKITALRAAAANAVEILFRAGGGEPDSVKIGLVPFASTVNVGSQYERAWWLDPNALSPAHHNSHTWNADINRWDLYDTLGVDWAGCVESRAEPHDMEDTLPNAATPATLFVPYFYADAPGGRNSASSGFSNAQSWIDDHEYTRALQSGSSVTGILSSLLSLVGLGLPPQLNLGLGEFYNTATKARQGYVGKYYYSSQSPYGAGPNLDCIGQSIFPLSTDQDELVDEIDAMVASGNTNIPNGIAWGVRVISPTAPFTEGQPYGAEELVKAMIVLTDGDNVMTGQNTINMSTYNTYGYIAEGRFGVTSSDGATLADRLDDKTDQVCQYAKNQSIRVYTITFQVSSTSTRQMMQNCASTNEDGQPLYWNSPSTAELENVFYEIARDLIDLRLSH